MTKQTHGTALLAVLWFWTAAMMSFAVSQTSADPEPKPITLSKESTYYQPLVRHLLHAQDDSLELSLDAVQSGALSFAPVTTPYADFNLGPARHWLWSRLENPSTEDGRWRVDIRRQYMHELTIYAVREGGTSQILFDHTDRDHFGERPIYSRFMQANIDIAAGETVDLYIAYRTTSVSYLPPAIGTIDGVAHSHQGEFAIDALFNGGLITMFILTVLFLPIIGWKLSFSFCAYITAGSMFVLHADSYTFQYLWPNFPQINDAANLGFMLLMPVFGLMFGRTLFDTKKQFRIWDKVMLTYVIIAALLSVCSPAYVQYPLIMSIAYAFVPVGTLIQLVTGIAVSWRGLIGSTPFLLGAIGVAISFAYAVIAHVQPGYWSLDRTLDVGHASILGECFAFASAIVLRMIAVRRDRDKALRAELNETRKRLRAEQALRKSQVDYARANKLSEDRLHQLASVSHDLRAPLETLRRTLEQIGGPDEAGTGRMHAAIDYLEKLARLKPDQASQPQNTPLQYGKEKFSIRIILDNISELFAEKARAKGIQFHVVMCDRQIIAEPVFLMRIVSNLVSNAIEHTDANTVLIGCRISSETLSVQIWDDGIGMSETEVINAQQRGTKSPTSKGNGLGIAIVAEQCAAQGFTFDLCSQKGKGTRAMISVPIAPEATQAAP